MISAITQTAIAIAFCINTYFCLLFLYNYWIREDKKITATILLNLLMLGIIIISHTLPIRGGYDSALCFGIARENFFALRSNYKEIAPILAYTLTDFISSKNLYAILFQNIAFSMMSSLMMFSCLRRLKLSMSASFAGTVFFCINFNNLIAASSMASTQCNLFFFISAIVAGLSPFYRKNLKEDYGAILTWVISSAVLLITSRAELAPVLLAIFTAGMISRIKASEMPGFFAGMRKYIAIAGLSLCLICSAKVLSGEGFKNRLGIHSPYSNAVYQVISNNVAMLYGHEPHLWTQPPHVSHHLMLIASLIISIWGCYLFCGNKEIDSKSKKQKIALSTAFFAAAGYLAFLYSPKDAYPLHFVRQRLYLFMTFPFIVSFAAEGFIYAAHRKKAIIGAAAVIMAAYSVMNARTAISLNSEQRTDDKMWQFMTESQQYVRNRYDKINFGEKWETSAVGLLDKYFFPKYLGKKKIAFFTPEYFLLNPKNKTEFDSKYYPAKIEKILYKTYFLPDMGKFENQETEFGFYFHK